MLIFTFSTPTSNATLCMFLVVVRVLAAAELGDQQKRRRRITSMTTVISMQQCGICSQVNEPQRRKYTPKWMEWS